MNKYKYIIFDWNGTLLDDFDANFEIENSMLQKRNLPVLESKEFYLENFSFPIEAYYELCGFDFSKESYSDVADEYFELYDEYLKNASLFTDVISTLEKLRANGKKLIIVSATEKNALLAQVEKFGIAKYFEKIIGSENCLGKSKIEAALEWFKTEKISAKEMLFAGDTTHDFETAQALGCDCVLVSRGHNSKRRLEETGCTVFDSLGKLSERF